MIAAYASADLTSAQAQYRIMNPTHDQWITIYVIIGYFVGIVILWNIPYLEKLLLPFKIITVAFHEFSHALTGCCTGAKIKGIKVNPDEGGVTHMTGGIQCCVLPAGYLGSALFGAICIFCGFDVLASKVMGVIIGVCLLFVLFYARNLLTGIMCLIFIAVMAVLFWYENGRWLIFFVTFMGVMSSLYSVLDIIDDLIKRKVNESDASKFSQLCCGGCISPRIWGAIWFLISIVFIIGAILLALIAFGQNP